MTQEAHLQIARVTQKSERRENGVDEEQKVPCEQVIQH